MYLRKIEEIFSFLLLGIVLPLFLCEFAITVWFYTDRDEAHILWVLLAGIIPGIIADFFILKLWVEKRFECPLWIMALVFFFYNVQIFGVFMGFPVFTLLMAVPAGLYIGRRLQFEKSSFEKVTSQAHNISLFTGAVMLANCVATGWIGLTQEGVTSGIQGMFRLGFEVTRPMLWMITLIGGTLLIFLQVWLTRYTIKAVFKNLPYIIPL